MCWRRMGPSIYGLRESEFVKRIFVANELFSGEWVFYADGGDLQVCPNFLRSLAWRPVLLT